MLALGELTRIQDAAVDDVPVGQTHGTVVESRWLAGLDAPPYLVGHVVELAVDGHTALGDFVHPRMTIADRERRGSRGSRMPRGGPAHDCEQQIAERHLRRFGEADLGALDEADVGARA